MAGQIAKNVSVDCYESVTAGLRFCEFAADVSPVCRQSGGNRLSARL